MVRRDKSYDDASTDGGDDDGDDVGDVGDDGGNGCVLPATMVESQTVVGTKQHGRYIYIICYIL